MHDLYLRGLFWILRNRGGHNGWPPREIERVSGWAVVRMLAQITDRTPRQVACDIIDSAKHMESEHDLEREAERSEL